MILLSWFYAKFMLPLVPKANEPFKLNYKSTSVTIYDSPLYLGILFIILMLTQCFWQTSAFYMFTQVFEKGILYEDVKFLEFQYKDKFLPITHRAFNIILFIFNIYFSSYFYYFALVQGTIYLMKTYPDYWFPYYQALFILLMRYWYILIAKIPNRLKERLKIN